LKFDITEETMAILIECLEDEILYYELMIEKCENGRYDCEDYEGNRHDKFCEAWLGKKELPKYRKAMDELQPQLSDAPTSQGLGESQEDGVFSCPVCSASGHFEYMKGDGIKCLACGNTWHKVDKPSDNAEVTIDKGVE